MAVEAAIHLASDADAEAAGALLSGAGADAVAVTRVSRGVSFSDEAGGKLATPGSTHATDDYARGQAAEDIARPVELDLPPLGTAYLRSSSAGARLLECLRLDGMCGGCMYDACYRALGCCVRRWLPSMDPSVPSSAMKNWKTCSVLRRIILQISW